MRQIVLSFCLLVCAVIECFAFDTTTPPRGVWTDEQYKAFWNSHKLSNECLTTVKEAAPKRVIDLSLTPISDQELTSQKWVDIYPQAEHLPSSHVYFSSDPPQPIINAIPPDSTKFYGKRNPEIDRAKTWFSYISTKARYEGINGPSIKLLKDTLLRWAKAGALRDGLSNPDMPGGIDYTVSILLIGIENSVSTVIPILTLDDKKIIAHWMNRLMKDASSAWFGHLENGNRIVDRAANGPFRQTEIVLIWALIINDEVAIQKVIDTYKTAIHDMRPDGTFVLDSNRGGMGLMYQNHSTDHLVFIASLLKRTRGIDVFSYTANGRNIDRAIEWVIKSVDDPSINKVYARSCKWGDLYGTVSTPSLGYLSQLQYLVVYASINPENKLSKKIIKRWEQQVTDTASIDELHGGAPAGLFGLKQNITNNLPD